MTYAKKSWAKCQDNSPCEILEDKIKSDKAKQSYFHFHFHQSCLFLINDWFSKEKSKVKITKCTQKINPGNNIC